MFSLAARQAAVRSLFPVLAVLVMVLGAPAGAAAATGATLAGHWTFDEGSGTIAADSSGGGHALTLQNGASWGPGVVGPSALSVTATGSTPRPPARSSTPPRASPSRPG